MPLYWSQAVLWLAATTGFNLRNKKSGQVITMAQEDPFREMMDTFNRAFRDMYATGQDLAGVGGFGTVPVDIEETADGYIVTADLPGVEKDQISLRIEDDTLHLSATHDREVAEEGKDYVRRERSSRQVQRSVRLPGPVDPDSAEASYDEGVLTVRIEKGAPSGTDVEIS